MSNFELYGYGESVASNMARVALSEKKISYKYSIDFVMTTTRIFLFRIPICCFLRILAGNGGHLAHVAFLSVFIFMMMTDIISNTFFEFKLNENINKIVQINIIK